MIKIVDLILFKSTKVDHKNELFILKVLRAFFLIKLYKFNYIENNSIFLEENFQTLTFDFYDVNFPECIPFKITKYSCHMINYLLKLFNVKV